MWVACPVPVPETRKPPQLESGVKVMSTSNRARNGVAAEAAASGVPPPVTTSPSDSAWLREPSAPPRFESEAILRVTFAENGTKDDLLSAIRSVREDAGVLRARAEAIIRGYVEGRGPFPQRLHLITLTGKFNVGYVAMLERWADWAEELVMTQWTDTRSTEDFPDVMNVFQTLLDELAAPPAATASDASAEDRDQ